MLVDKYGIKEIMDDSGSFPVGAWLETFCNEMIRRGLPKKVRIDCNMRFGRLTYADYCLMRKAGFQFVLFGVESANQDTLDRFCKCLKVEDVVQGCEWAHRAGLNVHVTFMFGHAWEGPREIANTVALARKLLAKGWASTLQCTLTIPYPGTPLFKELEASDGLVTKDWDEYDMRRAITKTPLASEAEIKCAIQEVYRGFLQQLHEGIHALVGVGQHDVLLADLGKDGLVGVQAARPLGRELGAYQAQGLRVADQVAQTEDIAQI